MSGVETKRSNDVSKSVRKAFESNLNAHAGEDITEAIVTELHDHLFEQYDKYKQKMKVEHVRNSFVQVMSR